MPIYICLYEYIHLSMYRTIIAFCAYTFYIYTHAYIHQVYYWNSSCRHSCSHLHLYFDFLSAQSTSSCWMLHEQMLKFRICGHMNISAVHPHKSTYTNAHAKFSRYFSRYTQPYIIYIHIYFYKCTNSTSCFLLFKQSSQEKTAYVDLYCISSHPTHSV